MMNDTKVCVCVCVCMCVCVFVCVCDVNQMIQLRENQGLDPGFNP